MQDIMNPRGITTIKTAIMITIAVPPLPEDSSFDVT
jgi:hypothetical protein